MTEQDFIAQHLKDDVRTLALQRDRYPDIDLTHAVAQIAGRQRIREKLPEIYANLQWELPVTLSLEQCSSEITARYKANLLASTLSQLGRKPQILTDLTGGFGIDYHYCSARFTEAHYVEQNEELCRIAEHNFIAGEDSDKDTPTLHHIHCGDSVDYLTRMNHVSAIVIDPARRDTAGRKVAALDDCTPDLTRIHSLLTDKADIVLVKLSPMLDMHRAIQQLPETFEIHIVSIANECKEMILLLSAQPHKHITVHCVNMPHDPEFVYTI